MTNYGMNVVRILCDRMLPTRNLQEELAIDSALSRAIA